MVWKSACGALLEPAPKIQCELYASFPGRSFAGEKTISHEGNEVSRRTSLARFPSCDFVSLVIERCFQTDLLSMRGARKDWKTSLESNRPRGVRRMRSPSRCSSPSLINSAIVGDKLSTACGPNVAVTSRSSTPRFRRKPRKKCSSSAAARVTTVLCKGDPATYFSRTSALARRTASASRRRRPQHGMSVNAEAQIRLPSSSI